MFLIEYNYHNNHIEEAICYGTELVFKKKNL